MPTHSTFSLPNESESLEKGKRTTMSHSMPPTRNCFNEETTPLHSICPQLVQKAHYRRSIWGETEISDTSEESSTGESLEHPSLKIHTLQTSMGVSKAGSTYSKSKGSSQCVSSHHTSVEEDQCEGTNISREINPPLSPVSPQENLMGQLHIVTTAGSMDIMNTKLHHLHSPGMRPRVRVLLYNRESPDHPPQIHSRDTSMAGVRLCPRPPFKDGSGGP